MNINSSLRLNRSTAKKRDKNKNNIKVNSFLSPSNSEITELKKKYIRFAKIQKTLSNKLTNKIIKESLILALREEFQFHDNIKSTFEEYLSKINILKNQVKKNKEEVELNCEKLKSEFRDKFVIVENFEKRIDLLNQEKKEIIRTNGEIIKLRREQTASLKKQFDKVQEDANKQMEEINKLKIKINELTAIKLSLNDKLEKELQEEEKKHQALIKEVVLLAKKLEYYQIEYDKFNMSPDELTKKDINLYDNTLTNELITEENLKVKLSEKNLIRDELMLNKQTIKEKMEKLEEEEKELKLKEKKFGKNLAVMTKTKLKKGKLNNFRLKAKYIDTNSNLSLTQRNKTSRRLKTFNK